MRVTRIHVPGPLAAGTDIALPAQAGEHLTRVLRLEAGAQFILFDGKGGEYPATLGARDGKRVSARVLSHHAIERESPLDVTLLQGIARSERMDLIVQKATELGVTRIVPVLTERSVVRVDAKQRERKHEHWHAITISACEQCGRNRVPDVALPHALADALVTLPPDSLRYLLATDGAEPLVTRSIQGAGPIVLLIGPEGGLTEQEIRLAQSQGFIGRRLGPRVLRTETAGVAALAALQASIGDFCA